MKKTAIVLLFLLSTIFLFTRENHFFKDQFKKIGFEVAYVRYLSSETRLYNAGELFISYEVFPNFRFGTGIMSTFPRKFYAFSEINSVFSDSKNPFFDGFHILFLDFGKDKLRYRLSFGGIQDYGILISSGIKYFFYQKRAFFNFEYRVVAFDHSNYVVGLGFKIK